MNKENKVKNVLFTVWVLIAFLLIQVGGSLPIIITKAVSALMAAGGDMNLYIETYTASLAEIGTLAEVVSTVVSLVAAFIWFMVGYRKFYSPEEKAEGRKFVKNPLTIVMMITGTLAIYSFDVLLASLTAALSPASEEFYSTMMDIALGGSPVLAWITLAILAPINEELIFRGIILRKSSKAFTKVLPIILVQAILFGIMHLNPIQSIYAMVIGLFLGYIAYKSKSVIPSILLHALNNIVADSANYWPEALRSVVAFAIYFVVLGAVTVFLFIKVNKKAE